MKGQILLVVSVLIIAFGVGTAPASNPDRIGTAGAQELTIPNSPRGLALGGGVVADAGGLEMLFYNPAAIASVRKVEATFSNLQYIADMEKNYVAVAATSGFGTLAVSADVLSIGDIIETTEENPEGTGRIFSPNFSVLGISYGRYMTGQVRVGGTLKLINEEILQAQASGIAFDAGILYHAGVRGLSFGLAVKNFGPNMRFSGSDFESFHRTSANPQANDRSLASQSAAFELPSYFTVGARYEFSTGAASSMIGYGTFQSNNFNNDDLRIGGEYQWNQTVALRAGGVISGNSDYLFGPTFGGGVAIPLGGESVLHADYAFQSVTDFFDDNHMFGVTFEF
jgi:hypothetical protein